MTETTTNNGTPANPAGNWKTRTYVIGTILGAVTGLLSAYLFAREAENSTEEGERPEIPPSALLGLALSALSLVRQISETGKKKKK